MPPRGSSDGGRSVEGDAVPTSQREGDASGPSQRPRKRRTFAQTAACQVTGCTTPLDARYHKKYRICAIHMMSPEIVFEGHPSRFCQKCGRFQGLQEFDDSRKTCRVALERHRMRRQQNKAAAAHPATVAPPNSDGTTAVDGSVSVSLSVDGSGMQTMGSGGHNSYRLASNSSPGFVQSLRRRAPEAVPPTESLAGAEAEEMLQDGLIRQQVEDKQDGVKVLQEEEQALHQVQQAPPPQHRQPRRRQVQQQQQQQQEQQVQQQQQQPERKIQHPEQERQVQKQQEQQVQQPEQERQGQTQQQERQVQQVEQEWQVQQLQQVQVQEQTMQRPGAMPHTIADAEPASLPLLGSAGSEMEPWERFTSHESELEEQGWGPLLDSVLNQAPADSQPMPAQHPPPAFQLAPPPPPMAGQHPQLAPQAVPPPVAAPPVLPGIMLRSQAVQAPAPAFPGSHAVQPLSQPYACPIQLHRLAIKVFNCIPEMLAPDILSEVQQALATAPDLVEACVRPGCTHLTMDLHLSGASAVSAATTSAADLLHVMCSTGAFGSAAGQPVLLQWQGQLAAANCGARQPTNTVRCIAVAQPLLRLQPACVAVPAPGSPWPLVQLLVDGRGAGIGSAPVALCRQAGRHLPVEVWGSSRDAALAELAAAAAGGSSGNASEDDSEGDSEGEAFEEPVRASPTPFMAQLPAAKGKPALELWVRPVGLCAGSCELEVQLSCSAAGRTNGLLLSSPAPLLVLPDAAAAAEVQQLIQHSLCQGDPNLASLLYDCGLAATLLQTHQHQRGPARPLELAVAAARRAAAHAELLGLGALQSMLLRALALTDTGGAARRSTLAISKPGTLPGAELPAALIAQPLLQVLGSSTPAGGGGEVHLTRPRYSTAGVQPLDRLSCAGWQQAGAVAAPLSRGSAAPAQGASAAKSMLP